MKGIKTVMLLFVMIQTSSLAGLNCSVDAAQFLADSQTYVDVNLRLDGSTCKYEFQDGKYSSSSLVLIYFKQDNEIKAFEKYILSAQGQEIKGDMLDMRRFFIGAGSYNLEILITDQNDTTNVFEYKSSISLKKAEEMKLSNALILLKVEKSDMKSPLVRNGIYMEVLPYMVMHDDMKIFNIYQEVYRKNLEPEILIHKVEILKEMNEDDLLVSQPLVKYKKVPVGDVSPILSSIDVSNLTSGNYVVNCSVIDKNKNKLSNDQVNIIINNRLADVKNVKDYNKVYGNTFVDALDSTETVYALKAIIPITNYKMMSTLDDIIRFGSLESQKYYLFYHWNESYPGLAEAGYTNYMAVARAVDKDYYSNVGHGFQTDRGYLYLKYGKPNKYITVIDEPNTPPYEIWYYSHLEITNQTDVRFIFYDPLQVNNFELLHSNCYGERANPAWETLLYKFNQDEVIGHPIIATEVEENWGRRAKRLFNEF